MKRRRFLFKGSVIMGSMLVLPQAIQARRKEALLMGVLGPISPQEMGITLVHEHLLADFIGASETGPHRYDVEQVVTVVLPYLLDLKKAGCKTFIDCTATFLGRDASLAKRLAEASGLNIMTNTGNYFALGGKFLPEYAHNESASQLASRWIDEWKNGIGDSGVYPGLIKIGVDEGPLLPVGRKLVEASALAHLESGLSISGHTGDGKAAMEEIEILQKMGVDPSAFRWVHAQNEKDINLHLMAARMGAYVEFDGIRPDNIAEHVTFVKALKENEMLHKVLISQDAGWYSVGEPNGGEFTPYTMIFELFIPALQNEGFTEGEINQLLVTNPLESFTIKVRKR